MKALLKTLLLATVIVFTANAFADNNVDVKFYNLDGSPIADGTTLTVSEGFFVAIINKNFTMNSAVIFHANDMLPTVNGSDIQASVPADVTFVNPNYEFNSCYETSYASGFQTAQDADPAYAGYLGADGNRSYCLVRMYYTHSTTPSQLVVKAQSPMSGISSGWSTGTLNLA